MAPEGAKKLELMRGAEPRLSRTREWIWERGVKDRGFRDPTAWGARSGSVCSFPFIWPQGGARAGGGRTGAGQPQPSRPAGRGERDRLKAWPLCTNPEVDRNQCWRRNLRVQEPRAQVDLKLMFDPSRDLCLMLVPQGFQARANLALGQGRS